MLETELTSMSSLRFSTVITEPSCAVRDRAPTMLLMFPLSFHANGFLSKVSICLYVARLDLTFWGNVCETLNHSQSFDVGLTCTSTGSPGGIKVNGSFGREKAKHKHFGIFIDSLCKWSDVTLWTRWNKKNVHFRIFS